ncbi:MAG: carbohydrate-binding domain-containing protein, partial [Bacteroidales bacterium]|nr:carbohydrate-binding domain-containing protein [Bacteroidales bacterium]
SKNIILRLRGASITNPSGPAVKINSDRKATVHLQAGTANMLKDGTASTGKGALQSVGEFVFQGTGTLNIYGMAKHGIQSSGATQVLNGNINILYAVKDGMNVDNFIMDSGSVTVSGTKGDGIDGDQGFIEINGGTISVTCDSADVKGLSCDSILTINGGDITVTVTGKQSKAIKTKQRMSMIDGTLNVIASGTYALEASGSGYDPSYCTGIKAYDYAGVGGNVTINCPASNVGGKGISADGIITINGGTYNITANGAGAAYTNAGGVRDTFSSACIKSNSNVSIAGNVSVANTGVDGKGITCDSNVTISNGAVLNANISGAGGKAVKTDGDLTVNGGNITITASGATAIRGSDTSYCVGFKTDGTSTFNGGDITITCTSTNNGGRCISADGELYINGGTMTLSTAGSGEGSSARGFSPVCIKVDSNMVVTGGEISCTSTGRGGRGIKVDRKLTIGTVGANDSLIYITATTSGANVVSTGGGMPGGGSSSGYKGAPKGIKVEGNITINSGIVRVYCSQTSSATAEGLESKDTIRINGGAVEVNAYDDGINATNWLCISGGKVWVNSRNNDALDCNGTNVTFSGGLVICFGAEQAVDVDLGERQGRSLTIGGATVLARGGNMGVFSMNNSTAPTMLNGQKYLRTTYTYGNALVIKNNNQQAVCVFKHPTVSGNGFDAGTIGGGAKPPGGGGSNGAFIFTSPSVNTGSYSAYTSATITGGSSWHGYYTGATVTTSGNGTVISPQQ